jgi:hypothetical protein
MTETIQIGDLHINAETGEIIESEDKSAVPWMPKTVDEVESILERIQNYTIEAEALRIKKKTIIQNLDRMIKAADNCASRIEEYYSNAIKNVVQENGKSINTAYGSAVKVNNRSQYKLMDGKSETALAWAMRNNTAVVQTEYRLIRSELMKMVQASPDAFKDYIKYDRNDQTPSDDKFIEFIPAHTTLQLRGLLPKE